jgi:small subunit ribosomal protein S17
MTIRVRVESLVRHPVYGKTMRRRRNLAVHDPKSIAKLGDMVEVVACRRLSKTKSWRLVRVLRSSGAVQAANE